jgi:hypothetical protein
VHQPGDRLVGGQRRGRGDSQHDHDPGQVLRPPVPVGVTAGRRAAAQDERDSQRQRGQRVSGVVQRVPQQRYRPGQHGDSRLKERGHAQHGQGNPQHPHALGAGLHRRVHLVGRLMRMRAQNVPQPGHQPRLRMLVLVPGVMTASVRVAHRPHHAGRILLQHLHHNAPDAPATRSRPTPQTRESGLYYASRLPARRQVLPWVTGADRCGISAQRTTGDGRSWTTFPFLRI